MNTKFQNIFILLFAAILAGMVFITVLFYRSSKAYETTSHLVSHTHTVLEEAGQIASLSKDLQLESAGFYFTEDSSFIPSFTAAKAAILQHLHTIKELTFDNALQQQRIDSLQKTINKLILFSEASLQKEKEHVSANARTAANVLQRRAFRQEIRALINSIEKEENRLLTVRQIANMKSEATVSNTFNTLVVLTFALLISGFLMTLNYFNKRLKAEEELRKTNERFDMLVNNIKDFAMFMIDKNGIVLNWYSGIKRVKGYSGDEIIGKPVSIFYTEEDIKDGIPERNLQIAAENGFYEEEGWRVKRDGTKFWADVVITAIYNDDGNVVGFTKVTRDFTLHKKAEDEMRHALEMAKELNTMKSSFVSMASHEFRTPLTSILTSAILVEQYKSEHEQEKRERHTKKIRASVSILTSILEEFLSLEKIESGKLQPKIQTFNLREFATGICNDIKITAKPGQTIIYQHTGTEEVNLDKSFMRYILTNLISNAIKYSPENTQVEVFINVQNNKILLRVKDNGIGISAEDQKRLFERFFRASNAGNIQGTGLGLHIIKRYVDMMNGTITLNSEPGKGTEFVVEVENQNL